MCLHVGRRCGRGISVERIKKVLNIATASVRRILQVCMLMFLKAFSMTEKAFYLSYAHIFLLKYLSVITLNRLSLLAFLLKRHIRVNQRRSEGGDKGFNPPP